MPGVGGWMFVVLLVCAALPLRAQMPTQLPPDVSGQLLLQQSPVDISQPENITATAEFDPPTIRVGQKAFYRVTIEATQNSIAWPEKFTAPTGLKLGAEARGQVVHLDQNRFEPLTAFLYEVQATETGRFVISNFMIQAGGQLVTIPAASLEVVEGNAIPLPPTRRLALEVSKTNLFLGQPFRVRLLLPVGPNNQAEALNGIQFNGEGFMTDKTAERRTIEVVNRDGQLRPAFIYETVATPIATGPLTLSAQGFTAPPFSAGPISFKSAGGPISFSSSMQPPVFLISDAVQLSVRPLPAESAPPGFTGAIGKFLSDRPQLATNRIRVGEPVHLKLGFHGEGNLTRFVPPPAPRSREWQIIADPPPASGFTLIPLTDEATNTPAIPFYTFDPEANQFYNLTIPALPVTVIGEGLPTQLTEPDKAEGPSALLKLSGLAGAPGKVVAGLKPLQQRGWFVAIQILPLIGFIALWRWDERRRFLEAHPEIVRRRRAKRDLRREKIKLQKAVTANDAESFVLHAAAAMRIAVAPHFPADARALVGGDVLSQMDEMERNGQLGETVGTIFAAADSQFAISPGKKTELLRRRFDVEAVLKRLEEKL
jgi:hypothetical protein